MLLWQPRIGERVKLALHLRNDEWSNQDFYVCGLHSPTSIYASSDIIDRRGIEITISEQWPPEPGTTDGYFIGRAFQDDDIVPA